MKFKLCLLIGFFLYNNTSAQVAIGKSSIDVTNTILDFDDDASNTKGLILSTVDDLPSSPLNGTFLYDKKDKKVKVFENNIWKSLSDVGSNASIVSNASQDLGKGVSIGDYAVDGKGVLVLESSNKAMVLPKIFRPEINVPSPYPGMMCYDTASKTLAIYDGLNWNYWK